MKNQNIIIFTLLFIILVMNVPNQGTAQKNDSTIAVIKLQFEETTKPPFSFLPYKSLKRPKVGIALSGGGLRGLAQIGVLHVLVENNIPIDFIAGSSIGAVIGGAIAAGFHPDDLWNIASKIEWENIISDAPPRSSLYIGQKAEQAKYLFQLRFQGLKPYLPQAITPGQQLANTLSDLIMTAPFGYISNFDSLNIPIRIITTETKSLI